MSQIRREHGGLDVLVNNAAIAAGANLGMISWENSRKVMEVNVIAVLHLMQLGGRMMLPNKSGSIINLSSAVGAEGNAGQSLYSTSKGAVNALKKSAAKECGASRHSAELGCPRLNPDGHAPCSESGAFKGTNLPNPHGANRGAI